MFGLLHNLYQYVKQKSERKITLVTLGLDNAGKTTIINTIQGLLDKDVTPTFGFNAHTLTEGKYTVELFDLGGSKNIRRIWKTYLSEVHAVLYVVDAADQQRFEESRKSLEEVLTQAHLHDKPVLVFANKQDLPTAASASDVATALGLTSFKQNRFNILGCVAKTPPGQQPDARLREGLKWAISQVNQVFSSLDLRVKQESAVVKEEEARKKKEREELARKNKEERLRRQQEEEQAKALAAQEQHNALANLPNQIESPSAAAKPMPYAPSQSDVPVLGPLSQFSDLQRPDQGQDHVTISLPPLPPTGTQPLSTALTLPPLHASLAAQPPGGTRVPDAGATIVVAKRTSSRISDSGQGAESAASNSGFDMKPSTSRPSSATKHGIGSIKLAAALEGLSGEREGSSSTSRHSNKVVPTTTPAAPAAPTPPAPALLPPLAPLPAPAPPPAEQPTEAPS